MLKYIIMANEKLIKRRDLRVPSDLDEGSEPQCNGLDVWQIPDHNNNRGMHCRGSLDLVYNTGLISESPAKAPCAVCGRIFG